MASKTKHTRLVRKRKHRPNKINVKTDRQRIVKNLEVLAKVTGTAS